MSWGTSFVRVIIGAQIDASTLNSFGPTPNKTTCRALNSRSSAQKIRKSFFIKLKLISNVLKQIESLGLFVCFSERKLLEEEITKDYKKINSWLPRVWNNTDTLTLNWKHLLPTDTQIQGRKYFTKKGMGDDELELNT